jgi:hypothetical protein
MFSSSHQKNVHFITPEKCSFHHVLVYEMFILSHQTKCLLHHTRQYVYFITPDKMFTLSHQTKYLLHHTGQVYYTTLFISYLTKFSFHHILGNIFISSHLAKFSYHHIKQNVHFIMFISSHQTKCSVAGLLAMTSTSEGTIKKNSQSLVFKGGKMGQSFNLKSYHNINRCSMLNTAVTQYCGSCDPFMFKGRDHRLPSTGSCRGR